MPNDNPLSPVTPQRPDPFWSFVAVTILLTICGFMVFKDGIRIGEQREHDRICIGDPLVDFCPQKCGGCLAK